MRSWSMISAASLLLLLLSVHFEALNAERIRPENNVPSSSSPPLGKRSGILATTKAPEDNVVHRPKSFPLTSSSSSPRHSEEFVGSVLPKGARKSTFGNIDSAFVGNRNQGMKKGAGLVLRDGMPKTARFFGLQTTIQNIVCYFARNGFWPQYPRRMSRLVEDQSRQVFELDDDRVRIFCRPQFYPHTRPQGPVIGVCCSPGGGIIPLPGTSTTPPSDYEYYTGTGEGSYTGEDGGDYYGRLLTPNRKGRGLRNEGENKSTLMNPESPKAAGSMKKDGGANVTTTTATKAPIGVNEKGYKRPIRSLRHKDIVVSVKDWKRKHFFERHQF